MKEPHRRGHMGTKGRDPRKIPATFQRVCILLNLEDQISLK